MERKTLEALDAIDTVIAEELEITPADIATIETYLTSWQRAVAAMRRRQQDAENDKLRSDGRKRVARDLLSMKISTWKTVTLDSCVSEEGYTLPSVNTTVQRLNSTHFRFGALPLTYTVDMILQQLERKQREMGGR